MNKIKDEDIKKVSGGMTISYKNCPRCHGAGTFEVRETDISSSGYCKNCGFHS